ncbi:zinc-dependent alcohol dehydrogenase family protein [Roseiconus nitratireducens]|uniref:Zinc-dependent alcohol dehydrogenase family protein n=1 Tax=Roseiconus nitratireducens TaxID=2605748 RepID=A0A5M6DD40_9BACT|nr:zinc-dependent alcohol dehydrogenase family protein [Roseiconus nitratireducens]KAA5545444.1 zinc-dependent alcohol dehydrogenase family protein [Roseiconus nitratireducens]
MRVAIYEQFQSPLEIREVSDLTPHEDSAVIDVQACGVCRSDWHAWMGHDAEVRLPHVPGHELAGVVVAVGDSVRRWKPGSRVTVPFCCGCGTCPQCESGNPHICDRYTQPGFTQWGAFAEQVEIRFADVNLVALPDSIDVVTAASLGCRFATSFRAIVQQGRVAAGQWVAVHGCGGVGLSAVMVARAVGAQVIAVDVRTERLTSARRLGALETIDASEENVIERIRQITRGGAHVSLDALGSHETCWNSIECLAKRGRHVQIGLTLGDQSDPPVPMSTVIARELELFGSHGMQAYCYDDMLRMIASGQLAPARLISDVVSLEQGAQLLARMDEFPGQGVTIIEF